jgi:UDP-N-acetylmuramoyl-L-alanyl-D-glutamate--2,6-diaminopimelate ligase
MADYHGKLLEVDFNGMLLNFNGKEFWTTLTGKFNVYNLLLVFGIAEELGFEQDEILTISKLKEFPEDLKPSNPMAEFSLS